MVPQGSSSGDTPIAGAPWQDLATRGFVHVRGLFSESELSTLSKDYSARFAKATANGNYEAPVASPLLIYRFESKLQAVGAAVKAATGIDADMTVCGLYFATEKGISFAWHQDHESYFIYQQHSDYLNFYIPLIKPDAALTNLCLVPFDRLEQRLSQAQYRRLVGSGASRFKPDGTGTLVFDDESGEQYTLPVDFEELKMTPQIVPGDLLLLRGDMIHRTQDTLTARVAVSFRRTKSSAVISKARLLSGGESKREMMRNAQPLYAPLLECFAALEQEELTAAQLASYSMNRGLSKNASA